MPLEQDAPGRKIEADIVMMGGLADPAYVTITDKEKKGFPRIDFVIRKVWRHKRWRNLGFVTATVSAAVAATEASKVVFPLISPDLIPLNRYPGFEQLSALVENPLGTAIFATTTAISVGILTLKDRRRFKTVEDKLKELAPCPPGPTEPPTS